MKCKYKESCGYEHCLDDCCPEYEAAVETNADRIRAMSDEELVENFWECFDDDKFCTGVCNDAHDCDLCRLAWLKQPVEGADNG